MSATTTSPERSLRTLVTGGARGIGAAIATRFAGDGHRVAIVDRDDPTATAEPIGALAVETDLLDASTASRDITAVVEQLGGIDVVVNNAGIFHITPILEQELGAWDRTFDVNTRSMVVVMQATVPIMIAQESGGSIINMASMGGKVAEAGQAAYAASKAAVIALSQAAAAEFGPHDIRVNSICPGYVLTEMGADTRTAEQVAGWSAKSPLGRCATPDDVAATAAYLASDSASYITGQAINVSGGMVYH